ncbi:hypothetical protein GCM10009827_077370 [Dactylosporangium maewongense]|uniref:GAF domain-containing protein n=1 Tax=Dactylosporangium maewongense TaxID=634393 RepID=A0ABN2BVH5_9ACTN
MKSTDPERWGPTGLDVPFDDRAGCGVILERLLRGERSLIGITFVTRFGPEPAHDLTLEQAALLATQITDAIQEARQFARG